MSSMESEKDSVRKDTSVVSGTMRRSVRNRHRKPPHPSEPPAQEEVESESRKRNLRGRSPSGKFARQPCKNYLKGICTKSPCDIWHPPECQFDKSESGCFNSAISARLHTGRLKVKPAKSRMNMVTKVQ